MPYNPTYGDFAKNQSESEYPEMWVNLVGVWAPFLGPSGKLMDWAGVNHGTLVNNPIWVPGALYFPGTNEYVDIGEVVSIFPFTLSIWAKMETINGPIQIDTLLSISSGDDGFYHCIYMVNDAFGVRSYDGTAKQVLGGGIPVFGQWYHVLGVFESASSRKLYVNGNYIGEDTESVSGIGYGHTTVGVTADSSPVGWFDGHIDQISIYNAALNAAQVKQLYEIPKGLFIPRRRVWGFTEAAAGISMPIVMSQMDQFNGGAML